MTRIRELVIQLDSDDRVRAHQAFRKLADAVDRVTDPGAAAEREALATSLATELIATTDVPSAKVELTNVPGSKVKPLQPRHSVAARRHLCRFLSQVASDAQVAALATALNDLEVRDAARCALECIPT